MTSVEFPILGTEPLPVEFANTLYGSGADRVDFLETPQWVDLWFAEVSPAAGLPAVALGPAAQRVRALRDCAHHLLSACTDGGVFEPAQVADLNRFAASAPTSLALSGSDREWTATWVDTVTGPDAVLGRIATCTIELLTGTAAANVRRCPGPDCGVFFVKNHSRRRFCDPSCGHRDRQARYYRRLTRDAR